MILALLLAQSNSQMPDNYKGISAIVVGSIVVLALVGGVILIAAQRTRTALAKEIKMELAEATKAIEVKVQSPVTFQTDEEFVTIKAHEKAVQELRAAQAKDVEDIKKELGRHAQRRSEIYDEQKALSVAVAEVKMKTDLNHQQLTNLDSKMDRVLRELPRHRSS
ncbi:MAG: hypothetical protein K0R17_2253 [Rariglobus sp.]|jgi:ribosome-binding factor A|nr:hypothetical protein [Microvirga sp.]MDF3058038.1 hypothetical protein [Rariglobus sp.]